MFVERAADMRTHPGQIAFPGGAADAGDYDLADTALREAAEETGVDRSGIDVLGVLPPAYVEVSGFDVTAVIAWWREPSPVAVIDSREATIDIVPVAVLTDPAHRAQVQHPSGYTGPAFEVNGISSGADCAPAGWRTRSCRVATALGSASWYRFRRATSPTRGRTEEGPMPTDDEKSEPLARWNATLPRQQLGENLITRYSEPHRRYHTTKHLLPC